MIESYNFGRIVINGKGYSEDLIIFLDTVRENWRREKGHVLAIDDIRSSIEAFGPEVLVVGTGQNGRMVIPHKTREYLNSMRIELFEESTGEACERYNRLSGSRRVMGAFHLTC